MKKGFFLALLVMFSALPVEGQMITTDPAVPTMGQAIKIYFNSSVQDQGNLLNYTGDLYAHTGVTANGLQWQHVIGTWGNNSTQPKLKYLGNYVYELDIIPDIKTFFGLSSTDVVTQICLVLRSADGTKQTRPDIFISIFEAKLNVTFITPSQLSVVSVLNRSIILKAAATFADSVSLYINDKFLKRGSTPSQVTDTILTSQYGEFWIKAKAWSFPKVAVDSVFLYVRPPVATEALPAGVNDGINYTSDQSVTLVLHAPYKNNVFAIGDFTGWVAREKGYMKRTPDSARYWIEINGLTPRKEYRFQYLVDSSLLIGDPYTEKILDPDNDKYITPETYPRLISYPKDTTTGIVSILQTAQIPYVWQNTALQLPDIPKLNIYELLVRDFVAKHDFRTLADTLHYLKDLGVNAIELMPVCEFEGNLSWGYNPIYYFAPDKYYGPKNDLKAFVDSCHHRGIAVIMDMVLNHCYGQSPLVQLYLDHYGTDQIYMKIPNPWFNASSPNPVFKFGADFNHESPSTQKLVDRINSFWMTEYKIDGFRFDFTKGFTNTPGDGSAYDPSRIAILERMASAIWSVNPKAYVILEHFGPNDEETVLSAYGMMLWGNLNYNFAEAAMGYTSDLSWVSWLARGWSKPNLVSYMESHDEERIMYKTLTYGASSDSYNTKDFKTALNRMALDAVFLLSVPGPKMIWQFGELGYDISIDQGGRTSEKPIKWDYFSNVDRHRLYLIYKAMNILRTTQPVFSSGNYSWSLASTTKKLQILGSDNNVVVLGNFGLTPADINPLFPYTGKWYEFFTGDSMNVTNPTAFISLQPGEFRLYSTKKLPSFKTVVSVEDVKASDEKLVTVYPNPSDNGFNIRFEGPMTDPVTITVLDMTGRVIRQIKADTSSGLIRWDGRSASGAEASDGIYLIMINTPGRKQLIKVIKSRR